MASINDISTAVGAAFLAVALLMVLVFLADTCTLRLLCIFFILVIAVMFVIDYYFLVQKTDTNFRIMPYFLFFLGVQNGTYAVQDIYDDLIKRKVAESDAYKYAELCGPCCAARCCGVIWGILSLIFLFLALYLSLVLLSNKN